MTTDEKIALIARAVLELAERAAREWDYDGEQMVGTGISLENEVLLRSMAEGGESK